MTNEVLGKMLAGLSKDERAATLTELGVIDPTEQAKYCAMADAVHSTAVAQPTIIAPAIPVVAPPAVVVAPPAHVNTNLNADMAALQAQLTAERTARVAAECEAFLTANATKITPAEHADVRTMFGTLGAMTDQTPLNQYKASLQARPANAMHGEQVASGAAVVLGSQGADVRTEAQKEADAISALLNSTDAGKEALTAAQAGKGDLQGAFKQFAISAPATLGK